MLKALLATVLLLTAGAVADDEELKALPPGIELVESVPLETERALDDPSIRQTQEVWLDMVNGAQQSLDLEFFYLRFEPKTPLEPVVKAVEAAKARGVRVRVLVDAKFLITYPQLWERWAGLGIELRKTKFPSGVQHTKLMLVDRQQVFLGSQNFDFTSLSHIRELGVHVTQPELASCYQQAFEQDWARAEGDTSPGKLSPVTARFPVKMGDLELFPVFSPNDPQWNGGNPEELALVELLRSARERIDLQVMTYSPLVVSHPGDGPLPKRYETLDIELRAAAARGVEVHLLVSDWGIKPPLLAPLEALSTVPHLEIKVSHIPPWSGGDVPFARVGHSKYLVVDGQRGWLGTSNWEYSYFMTSRDMGLVFEGKSLAGRLQQFFERDWDGPYVRHLPGK
jgi:phosphatidylserine/phosphatidylglycerophosphate/cardiolipin synthase-like enzyme